MWWCGDVMVMIMTIVSVEQRPGWAEHVQSRKRMAVTQPRERWLEQPAWSLSPQPRSDCAKVNELSSLWFNMPLRPLDYLRTPLSKVCKSCITSNGILPEQEVPWCPPPGRKSSHLVEINRQNLVTFLLCHSMIIVTSFRNCQELCHQSPSPAWGGRTCRMPIDMATKCDHFCTLGTTSIDLRFPWYRIDRTDTQILPRMKLQNRATSLDLIWSEASLDGMVLTGNHLRFNYV